MKNLNLNLNSRLTDANNITISSQKALKTYIDSKRILLDFLQDNAPTTFQTDNKWLNTSNLKLYTATSSSNWDNGISITTNELYTFDNVLYHYDGTNLSIYSTDSIKEQNSGDETKIWIGTQSEYDNLDSYDNNTIYNIIDNASVISTLLATQQEFNNSAQNKAATPYQVNQALGNYLPLAGGNFDTGAVVRFTNGNGTNSISYDSSNILNITNNVSVSNNLTANNIVATSGNIYKTNTSGDTVVWSNTLNDYLPLSGGTLTGGLNIKTAAGLNLLNGNNVLKGTIYGDDVFYIKALDSNNIYMLGQGNFANVQIKQNGWQTVQTTYNKGIANGIASLDSNTKVPTTQLPLATNSTVGVVKGDGTTTSVDASGVISVIGGGGGTSNYHPPLLSFRFFEYLLDDQSWLRADTFSWQSGTTYSNAYNHLVDDIDSVSSSTETISGTTITYYQASDGHKIVLADQENNVQSIYNATGVAWYYILDTANTQFKLPRTQYAFVGLRDAVGKYVSESLPNITGTVRWAHAFISSATGAYQAGANTTEYYGSAAESHPNNLSFDASRSSSTYQDSAPVQQRATQMYLYFYVGNFSQSATEQTAGLNAELFNGKADIDLSNLSTGSVFQVLKPVNSTLISSASGEIVQLGTRKYYKSNADSCFIALWGDTVNNYTSPILVGDTEASVTGYDDYNSTPRYTGTFTWNEKTYYYTDFHTTQMPPTETISGNNLIHLGKQTDGETAGKALLEIYYNTAKYTLPVETYQNGAFWYIVYPDGRCEQGCNLTSSASGSVTLLKQMRSDDYFCIAQTAGSTAGAISTHSRTTTGFTVVGSISSVYRWYVCGYCK